MRLLSTTDLTFETFFNLEEVKYTTLSHRWEDGEVTFKEMSKRPPGLEQRPGYRKIKECARASKELGCEWFWIDTCCIDKRSSAELTDSINSMFAWYSKAAICLVYLFDVHGLGGRGYVDWTDDEGRMFKDSEWFKRGWTLQELIAPSKLAFYDSQWGQLEYDGLLAEAIMFTTRIPKALIYRPDGKGARSSAMRSRLDHYSLAQKMSWAAYRETTMTEDIAYCLLGIFDVNMPLLYGEGPKAFQRLQEEIIKKSPDRTLFMWSDPHGDEFSYRGLLARTPNEFANCADFTNNPLPGWQSSKIMPYVVTHQGLQMQMGMTKLDWQTRIQYGIPPFREASDLYLISFWGVLKSGKPAAILVERLQPGGIHFSRVMSHQILPNLEKYFPAVNQGLFFMREPTQAYVEISNPVIYAFDVQGQGLAIAEAYSNGRTNNLYKAKTCLNGQCLAFHVTDCTASTTCSVILGYFPGENRLHGPISIVVLPEMRHISDEDVKNSLQGSIQLRSGESYSSPVVDMIDITCEPRMQEDRVICDVIVTRRELS